MDINTEFEHTMDKLIKASNLHPNISKLWTNYVLLKKAAYEKALHEANNMVETLTTIQDPDNETLIALFALSQVMSASNQ